MVKKDLEEEMWKTKIEMLIKGELTKNQKSMHVEYEPLSKNQESVIREYIKYLDSINVSQKRVYYTVRFLRHLVSTALKKEFCDITVVDLQERWRDISTKGTKRQYGALLTMFYEWYFRESKDGKVKDYMTALDMQTNFIKKANKRAKYDTKQKDARKKFEFYTWDDIQTQINKCYGNPRNEALIASAMACGWRPNELLSLRICDIKTTDEGDYYFQHPELDFVSRPLERAKVFVDKWLGVHPARNNPTNDRKEDLKNTNPLWVSPTSNKPLKYGGYYDVVKRITERAGYKDGHPHLYRHSFTTWRIIMGDSKDEVSKWLGHSNWSYVLNVYNHLKSMDYLNKYKNKKDEERVGSTVCFKCGKNWPPTHDFCPVCSVPITEKGKKIEEERTKTLTDGFKNEIKELTEKIEQVKELITTSIAFVDALDEMK